MKNSRQIIDIVIPFYNEELNLPILLPKIISIIKKFNSFKFRIICVNDGSTDKSVNTIKKFQKKYQFIKLISNKINLGQTLSYKKYLKKFKADFFIRIDADNQDNPKYISNILKFVKKDFDLIITKRELRKHSMLMIILTFLYENLIRILIKKDLKAYSSSLVCYKKNLLNCRNLKFNDHRYLPLISIYNGANKIKVLKVIHEKRTHGFSKYSITSKVIMALPEFLIFFLRLKMGHFKL